MNKECKSNLDTFEYGSWNISTNQILAVLHNCPSSSLFPLSPYEELQDRKEWWTAEITDEILIQENQVLDVRFAPCVLFIVALQVIYSYSSTERWWSKSRAPWTVLPWSASISTNSPFVMERCRYTLLFHPKLSHQDLRDKPPCLPYSVFSHVQLRRVVFHPLLPGSVSCGWEYTQRWAAKVIAV